MTDLDSPRYRHEEGEHDKLLAALDRSAGPVASLASLLGAQLDLVELALDLVRRDGAPATVLHRWLGWAATTARAIALGWTRDHVHHRVAITWPDGRRHTLVRRWTEVESPPLLGARWIQALAVAWILGDDPLVRGLADPALVAALGHHPSDVKLRAHYRVPLVQLLAALARNETALDLAAAARNALTRDLRDLERPDRSPPAHGMRLSPEGLRADVLPLLPVIEAVIEAATPIASLRAAFDAASAMRRPLVLAALATLARQRGAQEPLLPLLDELGVPVVDDASVIGAVDLDELPPTPALRMAGHDLDATALDRLAEALWRATSNDAWALATRREVDDLSPTRATPALVTTVWAPLPLELWRHALVHIVAHGRWAPRTHSQAFHLAVALDLSSRPAHEAPLGVRLAPAQLARALAAFDETPFPEGIDSAARGSYFLDVGAELVPTIARIVGAEPAALDRVTLTRSLETIVLTQRALAGDVLAHEHGARVAAALRDLATRFQPGCSFVVADATGATSPLDREAIAAVLARVAGPRWIDTLPAKHPLRPIDHAAMVAAEARRRQPLEAALGAIVASVRSGVLAPPAQLAELARSGRALIPVIAPLYDRLVIELAQSRSLEAARAAIALRNVATAALLHAGGAVSEDDARYLLRDPAIFDALPPDDQARWREDERITRVKLWDRVDSHTRGIVYASWADSPPPPPAPPDLATPGRRRRIIS